MSTEPNRPAFAAAGLGYIQYGLTKREYFTAAALQGLAAAGSACMPNWDELARMAVELADYTIVALNKEPKEVSNGLR